MPYVCQSSGGANSAKGPWDPTYYGASRPAISMTAPRSALPWSAKRILWIAVAVSAVMSLRFAMIGAWPVLIFSVLDIGGLYVALHMFSRCRPTGPASRPKNDPTAIAACGWCSVRNVTPSAYAWGLPNDAQSRRKSNTRCSRSGTEFHSKGKMQ